MRHGIRMALRGNRILDNLEFIKTLSHLNKFQTMRIVLIAKMETLENEKLIFEDQLIELVTKFYEEQ